MLGYGMSAQDLGGARKSEESEGNKISPGIPLAKRKTAQNVHRASEARPKTSTAYWTKKVKKPAGSSLYGIQIAYKGSRHRFPLETANREAAAEKARGIFLSLVAKGWDETLRELKPLTVKIAQAATIGAWLAAVKATSELRSSTFNTYSQSLRQIASEIAVIGDQPKIGDDGTPMLDSKRKPLLQSRFDYRSGGREAWIVAVEALPLSILTETAVQRWKVDYVARAGGSPDARRRAETSAGSLIRSARALFSAKLRKYASEGLVLPEPLPFAGVDLPKKGSTAYQSKIDAGVLIAAARDELEPEPLKIFALGLLCGFRKREIDLLIWRQVDFEKSVIRIERTEYFEPKSEDSHGSVDLDPEMVALLRGWKATATGPFVVESTRAPRHETSRANYRCAPHFKTLYEWLRTHGVTARKPLHELRKELGALLASELGIFAAKTVLRHAQISTTASYYTDKKKRITVGLGALLAPPPANVIGAEFQSCDQGADTVREEAQA